MGKKKVPEGKRFKPGQSGNPKGRPIGAKSFGTRVKELLAGIDPDGDWTNPLAAEYVKIIFSKYPKDFKDEKKRGKYMYNVEQRRKAMENLLDRAEGKAVQKTEIIDTTAKIELIDKEENNI